MFVKTYCRYHRLSLKKDINKLQIGPVYIEILLLYFNPKIEFLVIKLIQLLKSNSLIKKKNVLSRIMNFFSISNQYRFFNDLERI